MSSTSLVSVKDFGPCLKAVTESERHSATLKVDDVFNSELRMTLGVVDNDDIAAPLNSTNLVENDGWLCSQVNDDVSIHILQHPR